MKFSISVHAREQIRRRLIPLNILETVLNNPQQIIPEQGGKKAYQSKIDFGKGNIYLVRVIVDEEVEPLFVVTVYRTTKIDKYWR
ncbi:MAG: DUF4258 domain-containing protein [Candidatus Eremiobacterota bacterium]